MIEPQRTVAKRFHLVHGVGAKQHGGALRFELHDALKRLLGKRTVAHTQGFINNQDVRVGAGGNGKSQTHIHAAGVGFNRLVNELANARKFDNAFVQSIGFCPRKSHHCRCQKHIFTAGKFRVKACAQFKQRANFAVHHHTAAAGVQGATHHLKQR